MNWEFDRNFKNWNGCRPEELFTAPIKKEVDAMHRDNVFNEIRFLRRTVTW